MLNVPIRKGILTCPVEPMSNTDIIKIVLDSVKGSPDFTRNIKYDNVKESIQQSLSRTSQSMKALESISIVSYAIHHVCCVALPNILLYAAILA